MGEFRIATVNDETELGLTNLFMKRHMYDLHDREKHVKATELSFEVRL